ncbi:hypothetical protein [Candidatus Endomicrobiellum trichonymphae]|uniref:hypothetical protein n=1 Tax=Endomicrobium trichonymphae TaxID=1408204 RepID=UPI00086561C5|nr:hypothetical protein [Candidatus Endomicrobium trichonymphae]BAV59304.1 hypothetical protein RSTT_P1-005 [Candidatus Endomicrobium trichonymphae]
MKKMIMSLMCLLLLTNVAFANNPPDNNPPDNKNIYNNIYNAERLNAVAQLNQHRLPPVEIINNGEPFWQRFLRLFIVYFLGN